MTKAIFEKLVQNSDKLLKKKEKLLDLDEVIKNTNKFSDEKSHMAIRYE